MKEYQRWPSNECGHLGRWFQDGFTSKSGFLQFKIARSLLSLPVGQSTKKICSSWGFKLFDYSDYDPKYLKNPGKRLHNYGKTPLLIGKSTMILPVHPALSIGRYKNHHCCPCPKSEICGDIGVPW